MHVLPKNITLAAKNLIFISLLIKLNIEKTTKIFYQLYIIIIYKKEKKKIC